MSEERRLHQSLGLLPEWYTTNAWVMFKQKYLYEAESFKEQVTRISKTLSSHTDEPKKWEKKFFDMIWKGWLSPSTPVLANTGTDRGLPVSCAGSYTEDSVEGFYNSYKETAMLSKYGFGTSSYLSDIRPRGTVFGNGDGTADGIIPVVSMLTNTIRQIRQTSRRGAGAWYIDIEHADFWELCDYIKNNPDDLNIGWCIKDSFIEGLESGNEDFLKRYQRALKVKVVTGKGYFVFTDKANRLAPEAVKNCGIPILASQLCSEIFIPSNKDYTYTCVLSSLNLSKYDEWKDTETVFNATVFLDCVCSEFIRKSKSDCVGIDKAIKFTEEFRALGLGVLGYHTYFQQNMIPFESMEARNKTVEIFSHIKSEGERASEWMAKKWGQPKFCKGTKFRNATLFAVAPTMSTALLCSSVSQGIEPVYKNVYVQGSAAGDMNRINPTLLSLLKERGKYNKSVIDKIIDDKGSVQELNFLTEKEKSVFKTAFEIDQRVIIRLASLRQKYIDQGQSLNLFFSADASERYISEVHNIAFKDPYIKSLYYLRSEAGVKAPKSTCESCEG